MSYAWKSNHIWQSYGQVWASLLLFYWHKKVPAPSINRSLLLPLTIQYTSPVFSLTINIASTSRVLELYRVWKGNSKISSQTPIPLPCLCVCVCVCVRACLMVHQNDPQSACVVWGGWVEGRLGMVGGMKADVGRLQVSDKGGSSAATRVRLAWKQISQSTDFHRHNTLTLHKCMTGITPESICPIPGSMQVWRMPNVSRRKPLYDIMDYRGSCS